MCGRFNVTDNAAVRFLLDILQVESGIPTRLDIAPLSEVAFIYQDATGRHLAEGIWSILIERNPNTGNYRQIKSQSGSPLSTFNAASRNLKTSKLWKPLFRRQRAIIPASGFHEWGLYQGKKTCFHISPADGSAIAFAALYDSRPIDQAMVSVTATITLPGHPKMAPIHKNSIPLMLTASDFDAWLDPDFTDVEAFNDLMTSRLTFDWQVTPVDSPRSLNPIGESETLSKD